MKENSGYPHRPHYEEVAGTGATMAVSPHFRSHGEDRMTKTDALSRFRLFMLRGFLDERTCDEIVAEMTVGGGTPATIYGQGSSGSVNERVRKAVSQTPSRETVGSVRRRLLECKHEVEQHFGVSLNSCEEPQFLRYRVGDFFVAHQDGNTGLLRLDSEARRVSVVIFLSTQAENPKEGCYSGGSLVFHDWRAAEGDRELRFAGEAGTLVAFRSETTHEVTPVTHGERYSIASWYR
ncbi:MAG: 2OG-Fe(II) oxygenase [Pyrinomonadaceae bacterium]|nr:2OG-Fe(II) oxygenase [Pyrinomonadaceae bacterium]